MADFKNVDSSNHLSVDTLQSVSKDIQGSGNPIPLSPQWLLPKPGENKHGIESHLSQYPGHANLSDFSKSARNNEELHDNEKRRDAFKAPLHDAESGRRDRWRDEERDTNSTIRRDRWREADNELGDTRKMERWVDASSRHSGEARRTPTDRWNDSSNKDSNYEHRRESKWNTRWGPDEKESESWREKWLDSSKDGEVPRGKALVSLTNHGKEEREGDHYRPWRSSSLQNKGRGELLHHQTLTPNKQPPTFSHGRGRGENAPPTFSVGRGKVIQGGSTTNSSSSPSHYLGASLAKDENAHGEPSPLKYSRTKLLDIYRMTEMRSFRRPLDDFIEAPPSLTQSEPLEPLALCAPTPEELVVLKGIDKGDIVSSGTPQVSKEGPTARGSADVVLAGRGKLGSREDLPSAIDDYKEQGAEKHVHLYGSEQKLEASQLVHLYGSELKSEGIQSLHTYHEKSSAEALRATTAPHKRADEVAISREVSMQGSSIPPSSPWRSQSLGERLHVPSQDWSVLPAEIRSRTSELGWSNLLKDRDTLPESSSAVASSHQKDESKWHVGEGFHSDITRDSVIKRQLSEVLDRERETRKILPHPSPEDLSLYYKDPQGEIQGPFSGSDLIGWFDAGYFGIDLQVRLASASPDTPFSLLGDVMPHLRAKARPPPGFAVPKQGEIAEAVIRQKVNSLGKPLASSSEIDVAKSDPRNRHESMNEAENRFLESLMSNNINSSPMEKFTLSEGFQGYAGNKSAGMPMVGIESGNDLNYLLAQKMTLERQRSLPNPHSYWPGRDTAPMVPKTDIVPESPSLLLPSMSESPHPIPFPQNVDMASILQGVADKSSSSAVNNGVTGWSNFPVQGGLDMGQDKIDVNHNQHFLSQASYGVPQQRIQQQNQPSLTNIVPQNVDHPSGVITPEKLLSSGLSQDPQILNLLQQQYLLSQFHLNAQAPAPLQLSLLDKLILLKQQQKQEQQQQLLLQQRQHLLSQVLSEHQSHQRFNEPYGHLQTVAMPTGNDPIDHLTFRSPHELLYSNTQMPLSNLQGGITTGVATLPSQVSHDVEQHISSDAQLHLPHQIFENSNYQEARDAIMMEQTNENQQKDSLLVPAMAGSSSSPEVMGSSQDPSILQKHEMLLGSSVAVSEQTLVEDSRTNEPVTEHTSEASKSSVLLDSPGISDSMPKLETSTDEAISSESTKNLRVSPSSGLEEITVQTEQCQSEFPLRKDARSTEVREGKKASDKKSRKQKNAKAQSSLEVAKGVPSTHPLQQSKHLEVEGVNLTDSNSDIHVDAAEPPYGTTPLKIADSKVGVSSVDFVGSQVHGSSNKVETLEVKDQSREGDSSSLPNSQSHLGHRAWKPAPSVKPKSLLEIQQEEQWVAQTEVSNSEGATSSNFTSSSMPWAGVLANSEPKRDNHQGVSTAHCISDNLLNSKSKKSQLHDLLAEEVLAKSDERVPEAPDGVSIVPPTSNVNMHVDSTIDDDDFIQAKENKKSRKKSVKGKGVIVKAANSVPSVDPSSPIERGKSSRQVQQEKEVLPPLPSGPSLGDFVLWKGDPANPLSAPAWSTESGKLSKPTSLRDIQKEQEKRAASVLHQAQSTTPQKAQTTRGTRGSGTSWTLSGSSPSKSASPIQINSAVSTLSKSKGEDDLFWGPLDQSKQEAKQSDFPSLPNAGGGGVKSTPLKGILGGSFSRQKSIGSKADYPLSSSPAAAQSFLKGKREAITKHKEAMDFRAWCENETARLTGSKDTSVLEFCLKQSTTEAETLLIENLGSFDPDHKFIDKFLNYKEMLSADVLEIAFQARNDGKATGLDVRDVNADNMGIGDLDLDMAAGSNDKGGGKKKGKKGKKVSPSVLGFNVVSNRIMMGEIQTIED